MFVCVCVCMGRGGGGGERSSPIQTVCGFCLVVLLHCCCDGPVPVACCLLPVACACACACCLCLCLLPVACACCLLPVACCLGLCLCLCPLRYWLRRTGEYRPPSSYGATVQADPWRRFAHAESVDRVPPSCQATAVQQASHELPVEVQGAPESSSDEEVEEGDEGSGPETTSTSHATARPSPSNPFGDSSDGEDGDVMDPTSRAAKKFRRRSVVVPTVPTGLRLPQRETVRVTDDGSVELDSGHGWPLPTDPWFLHRVLGPIAFWTPSMFSNIEKSGEAPEVQPWEEPLSRQGSRQSMRSGRGMGMGSRQSMRSGRGMGMGMGMGSRQSMRPGGLQRQASRQGSRRRLLAKPRPEEEGVVDYLSKRYTFRATPMTGDKRLQLHKLRVAVLGWLAIGLHAMSNDFRRAHEAYRCVVVVCRVVCCYPPHPV